MTTMRLSFICSIQKRHLNPQTNKFLPGPIYKSRLTSMPYGTYRVNIYEHQNNNMPGFNGKKRFFYAPIVLLDHVSAYSVYNNVTKEPEMRFRVEMWNEQVEAEVIKYISLLSGGKVINKHQVTRISYNNLFLQSFFIII